MSTQNLKNPRVARTYAGLSCSNLHLPVDSLKRLLGRANDPTIVSSGSAAEPKPS